MEGAFNVSVLNSASEMRGKNNSSSGETRVMRISRALIATGFILVVSFSSLTDIILGPIQETALTPTKDLRTLGIPESVEGEATVWNVVFVRF